MFETKRTSAFVTAFALAASLSVAAPAYRAQLTVQGYAGAGALADFPVPVRISESAIPGFHYADCAEDGADIAFTDAGGATLVRPCSSCVSTGWE